MRTDLNRSSFLAALAALLAAATLRSATLEDLERMCHAGRDEYTALRDAIVAEGESALPFLDATLADEAKPWKVRFMAGVCTDYIRHGKEIEAFLKHDWQQDPDLQPFLGPGPGAPANAFPSEAFPVFYQRMQGLGTWWFFIESMFSLDQASIDRENPYRRMDIGVILYAAMPFRYFVAKWAEEWSRDFFSGKKPLAGVFADYLGELASDGTYPEGADFILAHPGQCKPELLVAMAQVTTNLTVLEELKTSKPDIVHHQGFMARIAELRRLRDEAEATARVTRAETATKAARVEVEAAARVARAKAKVATRAKRAVCVLLAVAASANLLAVMLLRHALRRRCSQ